MGGAEYNDPALKILLARRALRALLLVVAIAALAVGAASLPWYGERPAAPPRVTLAASGVGPLRAGAAAVPFELPADVPIGGFARLSYRSEGVRDPVGARAVVLAVPGCKVALASAEILLVPEALEEAVLARVRDLGLTGVVLAATHTHAGPGGYWHQAVGERIATGPYDARLRDLVVSGIADAIRRADGALAPARVSVARVAAGELARSRSGGAEDGGLTVIRLDREGGAPVAELVVFAAHPTILGKENRRISGDWPGRLLADGRRGVRLFFQGALGDQSSEGPAAATPESFGDALSAHVAALPPGPPDPAPTLAYAAVEVALPAPDPGAAPYLLRRAARNVSRNAFPQAAVVEAVRIGEAVLVAMPAEPVASVAAGWRAALPPGAEIVSLSGGYLGYVEEPGRMAEREGETVRTYFGPDLARRLGEAVKLGADRVTKAAVVPARDR
jgi:hypothetical protein